MLPLCRNININKGTSLNDPFAIRRENRFNFITEYRLFKQTAGHTITEKDLRWRRENVIILSILPAPKNGPQGNIKYRVFPGPPPLTSALLSVGLTCTATFLLLT